MQPILMTIKVRNTENGCAREAAIQPENDFFRIFGAEIYFKGVARAEKKTLVNLFKKCLKRLGFFPLPPTFSVHYRQR